MRGRVVGDRGQVLPVMVVVVVLAGAGLLALSHLGRVLDDAARARTAADAAALAGALDGPVAASEMATANGGRLESFTRHDDVVEVTVRVGRVTATARARREVTWEAPRGRLPGWGGGLASVPYTSPVRRSPTAGPLPP